MKRLFTKLLATILTVSLLLSPIGALADIDEVIVTDGIDAAVSAVDEELAPEVDNEPAPAAEAAVEEPTATDEVAPSTEVSGPEEPIADAEESAPAAEGEASSEGDAQEDSDDEVESVSVEGSDEEISADPVDEIVPEAVDEVVAEDDSADLDEALNSEDSGLTAEYEKDTANFEAMYEGGQALDQGAYRISIQGGPGGGATAFIGENQVVSANEGDRIRLRYDGGTIGATVNFDGGSIVLDDGTNGTFVEFDMPAQNVTIALRFASQQGGDGGQGALSISTSSNGPVNYNVVNPPVVAGKTIQFTLTPGADGWTLNSVTATWKDGGEDKALDLQLSDGVYSFDMPDGDVTIHADLTNGSGSGGQSVPAPTPAYPITLEDCEHGTIAAMTIGQSGYIQVPAASEGAYVWIQDTPEDGYRLDSVTVTYDGQVINQNGWSDFTMPAGPVTVSATFVSLEGEYGITIAECEHGTITARLHGYEVTSANEDDGIDLDIVPNEGYRLDTISVIYDGDDIVERQKGSARCSFTMPKGDVGVSATFVSTSGADYQIALSESELGSVSAIVNGVPVRSANEGDWVWVESYPENYEEYRRGPITVKSGDDIIELKESQHSQYFIMPAAPVTVSGEFISLNGEYEITFTQGGQGTIYATPDGDWVHITSANEGDCVKLYTSFNDWTQESKYRPYPFTVKQQGGADVEVKFDDGDASFIMPAAPVTVSATFISTEVGNLITLAPYEYAWQGAFVSGYSYEFDVEPHATAGETVEIGFDGPRYRVGSFTVTSGDKPVEVREGADREDYQSFFFTMPDGPVTVTAIPDFGVEEGIPIDVEHFPDGNFRAYISENIDNGSGVLTKEEIKDVDEIHLWKSYDEATDTGETYHVADLTGIKFFTSLKVLSCDRNDVTKLDVSGMATLTELNCSNNMLAELNIDGCTNLEELWCGGNALTTLDLSKHTALKQVGCGGNKLTELKVSGCADLFELCADHNQLTTLDVSKNTALKFLWCYRNNLTELNVATLTELEYFGCDENSLTSLDVSKNVNLSILACGGNNLQVLDVTKNTGLQELYCWGNSLTELDVQNNKKLETLHCDDNNLKELVISNCPKLVAVVPDPKNPDNIDEDGFYGFGPYKNDEGEADYHLCCDPTVTIISGVLYDLAISVIKGKGQVIAPVASVAGATVEFMLTPDEGYTEDEDSVAVTYGDKSLKPVKAEGKYSFAMPEADATICAAFKKLPNITVPAPVGELTYNGTAQALVTAGATDGGTLKYSTDDKTWSAEIPTATHAGEYSVYYMVEGDEDCATVTAEAPIAVTIAPAKVTVAVENQKKAYGAPDPENPKYEVIGPQGDELIVKIDREKGENVKSYNYTAEIIDNTDYEITKVTGKLTIEPKEVALSWSDEAFTYNGKEQLPKATVTNVEKDDECNVIVAAAEDDDATGAGEHKAVAASLSNANYKLPKTEDCAHLYTIAKAAHENVDNALTIAVSANGVAEGKADLSACIPEGADWAVKQFDGTLITQAEKAANCTLNYTAAPAGADVTGGSVTIEITTADYEPYTATVSFTTSDVFTLTFFDSGNGEIVETRKLHEGVAYGDLPDLSRAFYTFGGWADSAGTKATPETEMGAGDVTVFAQWTANPYKVKLELNGHGAIPDEEKDHYMDNARIFSVDDDAFDLPNLADANEAGKVYTFSGWTLTGEEKAYIDVTIDPAAALATLTEDQDTFTYTASWTEGTMIGSVTYEKPEDDLSGIQGIKDMGDDEKVSTDFAQDDEAEKSTSLAEALKQIAAEQSEEIVEGVTSKTVTVDMKVSATDINEDDKNDILVQIEQPDVEGVDVKTDFINIDITQTTSYTDGEGVEKKDEPKPVTELKDRVLEIPLNYDMTGRYNMRLFRKHTNDKGETETKELKQLSSKPKSSKEREDGTFFISGQGPSAVIYIYSSLFSTFAFSSDNRESFEVRFDSNGGSEVPVQKVYKAEKVIKPADPTKAATATVEYSFDKWCTDAELKNEYDFESEVTEGFTLYARWKETAIEKKDEGTSSGGENGQPETTTPAATTPAATTPAPEPTPVIPVLKKNVKKTVSAAPGAIYQIDLGGKTGKSFKSSKKKVAVVDQTGLITIKAAGKTKITLKVGKKKRTLTLTVKDPTIPTSVSFAPVASKAVKKGDTVTLVPVIPDGTNSTFKWKSSNKKVASVSSDGTVTFKKKGKVTITATAKRGGKKAKIKFTVSNQ